MKAAGNGLPVYWWLLWTLGLNHYCASYNQRQILFCHCFVSLVDSEEQLVLVATEYKQCWGWGVLGCGERGTVAPTGEVFKVPVSLSLQPTHSQIVFISPAGNTTSPRERPGLWSWQDNLREMRRQRDSRGESVMRTEGKQPPAHWLH